MERNNNNLFETSKIILASASPRRRELLRLLTEDFEIISVSIQESALPEERPETLVMRLATAKAEAVQRLRANSLILGADTIVVCDGHILGKPSGLPEARKMLELLSGRTHSVLTGICLLERETKIEDVVHSRVTFNPLSAEEIEDYLQTGEPMDKAGAYAIQGYGSRFIQKVDGCYFNVVGLPVSLLYRMLRQIGYRFHG